MSEVTSKELETLNERLGLKRWRVGVTIYSTTLAKTQAEAEERTLDCFTLCRDSPYYKLEASACVSELGEGRGV